MEMNATNRPFLKIENISKSYYGISVLEEINMEVDSGEILALIGENGAGKSTLIKILSGAVLPNEGRIYIDGKLAEIVNPHSAGQYKIVTVYQEFSLFPDLTVAENLFFGHYSREKGKVNWKKMREDAGQILDNFHMKLDPGRIVSTLSVAEKQTLEIAKALYQDVSILILDEPTAVLGEEDAENFLHMIRELKQRGVAVIFISHRLKEIFGFADKYMVLRDGVMVDYGKVEDVTQDQIVEKMVGRHIEKSEPAEINYSSEKEVLRVESLNSKNVLKDINFSLYKGEVLGFAGLRGAGRTELAQAIFGADAIDSGRIYLNGKSIGKRLSPRKAIMQKLAMLPEERKTQSIFENMSVEQNMFMAYTPKKIINYRIETKKAGEYIRQLNIKTPSQTALISSLSGGNQQKTILAKWLETGAEVFILDEPTRGIDIGAKAQIYSLVKELCEKGKCVILISSELPELLENCHRILVLHLGEIAGELYHVDATEEKIMKFAVGEE